MEAYVKMREAVKSWKPLNYYYINNAKLKKYYKKKTKTKELHHWTQVRNEPWQTSNISSKYSTNRKKPKITHSEFRTFNQRSFNSNHSNIILT